MAAMSERFTARALWPSISGSTSGKKCVPCTIVSVETARSMPLVTSTSAQSSPTPSTAFAAGRVKCRAMRSNSGELFAILLPPVLGDLFRADRCGQLVEDAIHVFVPVGAAEALAQLDRLVDRHAVRDLGAVHQLPRADHQDGAFDGAHLVPLAVGERLELLAQALGLVDRAAQLGREEAVVGLAEILELGEVLQDVRMTGAGEDPLVDALHRELARAPARRRRLGLRAAGGGRLRAHPATAFRVLAISTATRAASAPFTAARSFAWSSVVVVSTPLATGMPVSSCTSRMPRALSLETTSK